MATYPIVGDWYQQPGGYLFEVVALDEQDATVEIQHFDGTVEEIDLEAWHESLFENAEAPEDWSGSVDMEQEDLGGIVDNSSNDYSSALDYLDRVE